MNTRYIFKAKQSESEYTYNPDPATYKFYQICLFKNPNTNKYQIRRCIINEQCKLINISEKMFNDKQYQKFLKIHRENEYKSYPTYDLNLVDLPNPGDILQVQSPLLNNDYSYTGFASYN